MPCSLVNCLDCFTPCVFNFEWCHASDWSLASHYLCTSFIRGFLCTSRWDSALKRNACLKYNVLEVCSESSSSYSWFVTPTLFLAYQITFHQFVTHLLMNAPTCLCSTFLDSLFFPRSCYDPLVPFLLFKAVVFFIGNWSKCSLSANVLSSVIFT